MSNRISLNWLGSRAALAAATFPTIVALVSWGAQGRDGELVDASKVAAARIDAQIEQALAGAGLVPNGIVDDATFVRRAYLTILGRIPSLQETTEFLGERAQNKRDALVDRLLEAPGRVSHEFNQWAELLRARSNLMRQTSGEPFLHWLKDAIAGNMPYDRMVHAMLTASGPAHEEGKGATGYLLRDTGMPLDSMANTLRIFTGTRMECAQCHNHPFDKWKQTDFFEMAAFQGGVRYAVDFENTPAGRNLREVANKMYAEHGRQAQQAVRRLALPATVGISGGGTGVARLPRDYSYDDHRPNAPVVARAAFGPEVSMAGDVNLSRERARPAPRAPRGGQTPGGIDVESRLVFADWLTAPDNPRFAVVGVNRIWKRIFGLGLIEPVDDLRDDTVASNPEVMTFLSDLFVELDFDVKALQRVLLRTRLFQRASSSEEPAADVPYLFPGPVLLRMSPEQMWDSLLALVVTDVDALLRPNDARAQEVYQRYEKLTKSGPEELGEELELMVMRYTDPQKFQQAMRERRLEDQRGRRQEQEMRQREARPILRALAVARQRGDEAAVRTALAKLQELGVPLPGQRANSGAEILRASDLPQPAPASHLLRQFGQTDREMPDPADRTANVPQVLTMLNGFCDQRIFGNAQSALRRTLEGAKTPDEKVKLGFLSVLQREPSSSERTEWVGALKREGEAGLRDLVWVLINSHEFRFVR